MRMQRRRMRFALLSDFVIVIAVTSQNPAVWWCAGDAVAGK
jgi:hypothetical protein